MSSRSPKSYMEMSLRKTAVKEKEEPFSEQPFTEVVHGNVFTEDSCEIKGGDMRLSRRSMSRP